MPIVLPDLKKSLLEEGDDVTLDEAYDLYLSE